jgi:transposase
VRDAGSTVIQAARDLHLSWPTVMNAFRAAAREGVRAPLPEVEVLGIDETRRVRPRWEQDPDTGKWKMTRDRWHTGLVDALGSGALLGQVEGRTVADVLAWLSTAVRTGLPEAIVVVDHFHVVQLANKMLSPVRRRTTAEIRGRRGRAGDPGWKTRRRLLRNREDLNHEQFERMWNPLLDEGKVGQTLLMAWIAKESLCTFPALACTDASRNQVGHACWKFLTWCADAAIPEVRTLAATVDRWWPRDRGTPRRRRAGTADAVSAVASAAHLVRD